MAAKTDLLVYEFDLKCRVLLPDGGGSFLTPICGSMRASSMDAVKSRLDEDYHVGGKSLIEALVITEHRADGSSIERWFSDYGTPSAAVRDVPRQQAAESNEDEFWLGECTALAGIPDSLVHHKPCTYKAE